MDDMAENESLDIDTRYGKAWKFVVHTAESGQPFDAVGRAFKKTLHGALKRVLKQFERCGVTVADFLEARDAPSRCRNLLHQCMGHAYARLLVDVLRANPSALTEQVLHNWLYAIRDKISDQISQAIITTEHYPSFFETERLVDSIEIQIERDIENIGEKLIETQ